MQARRLRYRTTLTAAPYWFLLRNTAIPAMATSAAPFHGTLSRPWLPGMEHPQPWSWSTVVSSGAVPLAEPELPPLPEPDLLTQWLSRHS